MRDESRPPFAVAHGPLPRGNARAMRIAVPPFHVALQNGERSREGLEGQHRAGRSSAKSQ